MEQQCATLVPAQYVAFWQQATSARGTWRSCLIFILYIYDLSEIFLLSRT